MANTLVTSAVGYVFWLVAAHLYGAPVVGSTASLISASAIVMMLSIAGVGGTLIQSLPGQEKAARSATFWAAMATVVFFVAVLSGIAVAVLPLLSPQLRVLRGADYAAVFAIGTIALAAGATLDWVFIAERRARNLFSRNSVAALIKIGILGLLGLVAGPGALRLLGAWGAAAVFGLGLGATLLVRSRSILQPPGLAVLVRSALEFRARLTGNQVIGLAGGMLQYLLPLLVTIRLSTSDTAYFYATWMLVGLLRSVSASLTMSLFAEGAHRPDELAVMAQSAIRTIGAILVPGSIVVLIAGGRLLSAFGPAYADHAVGLLRTIVAAAIPEVLTSVYGGTLLAQRRLAAMALLTNGMSFGTLIISWFLLPVLGISAVGWALLAMQLCGCLFVVIDRAKRARLRTA